ncbi:MAG TPA: hypothetical protein VFW38_10925 [Solirubrobacteraceae bacterium]|nr:hypothetical protein [Solirubrobacteraceae bacterium]
MDDRGSLPFRRLVVSSILALSVCLSFVASAVGASFGVEPGSVSTTALNADGTIDSQASSHPFTYTVSFALNTNAEARSVGGELRDVLVDLPRGFVGDPLAVPRCSRQDFEGLEPQCSPSTQVGILRVSLPEIHAIATGPIYNMVPPPGVAAQLGFSGSGFVALEDGTPRTEEGYGLRITTNSVPLEVTKITATIWGVPASPGHNGERGRAFGKPGAEEPTDAPVLPFLTLPAECTAPLATTVSVDSKLDPGHFVSETAYSLDAGGQQTALVGCGAVPFSPRVSAAPTGRNAGNPTGLEFTLGLPNEGLLSPNGITETEPEKIEVALPEGITANPSAAVGLVGCSEAQFHAEAIDTAAGQGCPEASKIGSIVAHSPLLEEPIEGALYMATPYANPSKTLVGLYVVARAAERGVLIKQAGRVIPDPVTGQLVTTFEGLPPLPYSGFTLRFREGARSLLVTPPGCGSYKTVSKLTPFSNPAQAYEVDSYFQIEHGVQGGTCPAGGAPPFDPSMAAGTVNNAAGAYSTLGLSVERKDGEQEITGFATQLPPGLSGNLSGIPFCGEAEIKRAEQQSGSEAETSSACPAASQIGHTVAEAGVGAVLAQTPGKLYLAGPFEGASFSVVDVTSAKVGPFDLGTVVVHLPLRIDPITAQVSIPAGPADQIPHIIKGIVIHLRDIRVYVDRPDFTLNPTSCAPMSIGATVVGSGQSFASSADDVPTPLSGRFQAADCASLAFKPTFKVSVSGKNNRRNGASLKVKLTYPKDALGKDANIRAVKVNLPKQLPSRLTTLQKACTARQFEANPAGCPAASKVGTATAVTPILPVPLTGPAYFVSHGGAKFPELVIVLQGYGITIQLHGETFINEHTNITSSTFRTVPDQPVTSFELSLPQGPNSALAAIGNLCAAKLAMPTAFTGQNGAAVKQNTPIVVTGCPKHKATKHKAKHKKVGKAARRGRTARR